MPPLCGQSWRPGEPIIGCQGRIDAEHWTETYAAAEWDRRVTAAGIPAKAHKLRAKMEFPAPESLLQFEAPSPGSTAPWGCVIIGATGTGKTTAMVSALAHYLRRHPAWRCRYITEQQLAKSRKPQGRLPARRELSYYAEMDLLLIDEVGRETTEWVASEMNELLDARYQSGLPIIMASNLGPKGLEDVYGQRFCDRLLEMGGLTMEGAYLAMAWGWRVPKGQPIRRPIPE
ncbi:MAG: ATP-binding protein [Myxococcota bacterium]